MSNPPIASINVPPPSRQSQRSVDRQSRAPRHGMHPHWTMSEGSPSAAPSTPPRRNLFSPNPNSVQHRSIRKTLANATPSRGYPRNNTPTRSNTGEFCGLTAEITRELHQRSAKKTPRVNQSLSDENEERMEIVPNNSMETPPRLSRKGSDIFRISIAHELTLTQTISASSSEDVSPKENVSDANQQAQPPVAPSTKKKRGISTPLRMPKSSKKIFSSAKKLKKCLTPPREGFGSHLKSLRNKPYIPGSSQDEIETVHSPGSVLSTALPGADEFKIHSTEYDPFDFQCEIPSKKEVLAHAKICNVVDGYTSIHLEFNFAILAGLTRKTLQSEYDRSTEDKPMIANSCHREVVKAILECQDDLVVEGFFREYVGGEANDKKDDRIEVVVFSSEKLRQIVVCFRGSTARMARPLKMNYFGKEGE